MKKNILNCALAVLVIAGAFGSRVTASEPKPKCMELENICYGYEGPDGEILTKPGLLVYSNIQD